jgi:hypothetical protein
MERNDGWAYPTHLRSCQHRTRQGGPPRSGSLNKNDIQWRRGCVLRYVSSLARPPVSPGYKLGDGRTKSSMKPKVVSSETAEPGLSFRLRKTVFLHFLIAVQSTRTKRSSLRRPDPTWAVWVRRLLSRLAESLTWSGVSAAQETRRGEADSRRTQPLLTASGFNYADRIGDKSSFITAELHQHAVYR